MKNVYAAILVACMGALGSLTVQAQANNTATGEGALTSNTTGVGNSAFGYEALYSNTTGTTNTAVGLDALHSNTAYGANTAIGDHALYYDNSANNTATGSYALYQNTSGGNNTATGESALQNNTSGFYNIATGYAALANNTTGNDNIGIGVQVLTRNSTGSSNIAIGYYGGTLITGSNNIAIGSPGASTDSGAIRIGNSGTQTSFYAAGVNGVQISDGVPVYINSNGQLGTVNSSIRFKEDVHDMADASDKLFQLRPVTYRYKQAYADGTKPVDYGLIAEEVAQVYPDMVARDASGQIQTVQYQKLTPMLLNEVQKQHHQLDTQQDTIHMLEQRLSALEATMDPSKSKTQVGTE